MRIITKKHSSTPTTTTVPGRLVVYDSDYGNTRTLAETVAASLGGKTLPIGDVSASDISKNELIVFGSPTQGGRPTKPMQAFIESLSSTELGNKRIAAFDTRFAFHQHGRGIDVLMKVLNFAAPRMLKSLAVKGGRIIAAPEGFIVDDKTGPIHAEEIARARKWAAGLVR